MVQSCKIGVYGAGAIGCYLGGLLKHQLKDKVSIVFVGREKLAQEFTTSGQMKISDLHRNQIHSIPSDWIEFSTSVSALKECDIILVTVKSQNTTEVGSSLSHCLSSTKGTIVISLQNGLENPNILRDHIPFACVLAGVVEFNVVWNDLAHFHRSTDGGLFIETTPCLFANNICLQSRNVFFEVTEELRKAGLQIILTDRIKPIQRSKLLLNLINSVNALAGCPIVEMLSNRTYRHIYASCVEEGIRVFQKSGEECAKMKRLNPTIFVFLIRVPNWFYRLAFRGIAKLDSKAISSTQQDLLKHKQTEVDWLNGEIVKIGEKYSVPTPINKKFVELIHEAEVANNGPPKLSPDALASKLPLPPLYSSTFFNLLFSVFLFGFFLFVVVVVNAKYIFQL